MNAMPLGYHLILDLRECKKNMTIPVKRYGDSIVANDGTHRVLLDDLVYAILNGGMSVLNRCSSLFENGAWTTAFILEESHVTFHTWPEYKKVYCDIYVCNYSKDNREGADKLANFLYKFFDAEDSTLKIVERT
jgi:S-adenosylmethionine/arginine decarboxylase-like enzyme